MYIKKPANTDIDRSCISDSPNFGYWKKLLELTEQAYILARSTAPAIHNKQVTGNQHLVALTQVLKKTLLLVENYLPDRLKFEAEREDDLSSQI